MLDQLTAALQKAVTDPDVRARLAKRAIEKGVAGVPGAPFYCANPDHATLRLSFATVGVEKIPEGVGRLGAAV